MQSKLKLGFADRLKQSAAAKQALVQQLRPTPARIDPNHAQRAELRAAEIEAVRKKRADDRAAAREAAALRELELQHAQAALEEASLQEKRSQRKERKALCAAEAKAKRDAKYAARKARQ